MGFIKDYDPYGVFAFCCGEDTLTEAEQLFARGAEEEQIAWFAEWYRNFFNRMTYEWDREEWLCDTAYAVFDTLSVKEELSNQIFLTLRTLTKIGVEEPSLCFLLTVPFWPPSKALFSYIDKHGGDIVAQILNVLVEDGYLGAFVLIDQLDEIFFNKEYPNPLEATNEVTGTAFFDV